MEKTPRLLKSTFGDCVFQMFRYLQVKAKET